MDFGIDAEFNDYIMVDVRKLKPVKRQRYSIRRSLL